MAVDDPSEAAWWFLMDIDGTADIRDSDDDRRAVSSALSGLAAEGWLVALATARRPASARLWMARMNLSLPVIALNGSLVGRVDAQRFASTVEAFPASTVAGIDAVVRNEDAEAAYYLRDGPPDVYLTPASWTDADAVVALDPGVRLYLADSPGLDEIVASRVSVRSATRVRALGRLLDALGCAVGPSQRSGSRSWSLVVHPSPVNKVLGARALGGLVGSPLGCFGAAGDDVNDVDMLGLCDVGFVACQGRVGVAGRHLYDLPDSPEEWASLPRRATEAMHEAHRRRRRRTTGPRERLDFHGFL